MNELTFFCEIKRVGGRAIVESPERAQLAERVLEAFGEGPCRLVFQKIEPGKTHPQLGYFFAVIVPEIREGLAHVGWNTVLLPGIDHEGMLTGETYEARMSAANVATYLKLKHLEPIPVMEDGEKIGVKPPSIARLKITEMVDFIDACIWFAVEDLGIKISEPPNETAKWAGLI